MAVLLDFRKAYDTLDRGFLSRALVRYGFPADFARAVDAIHSGTSVRFSVASALSGHVAVSTGIRQGCPLAPLLFVIAINTLLEALQAEHRLPGVRVNDVTVTGVGYADDTGVYLTDPRDEPILLSLLGDFGAASGLRINISKSAAVLMSPTGQNRFRVVRG
ncbi:hypothetical protein ATCC90586_008849 [Pythium insidiosum]|nr:hypothetical protein ATCC90586_008849 [Pythium insidiosum]